MFAVIMAGGAGTRFWPASRRRLPKQFLNITGRGPMVVETCNRLDGLVREEHIVLVLGREHLPLARKAFEGRGVHLVAEPVGRNTGPCIGLGALYAQYLGCTEAVAFMPADHFIGNAAAFLASLRAAEEIAASGGIVTLGIVPDRPETGYGYIRKGTDTVPAGELQAHRVSEFVEKPDAETAQRYVTSGRYYWNGGIFVATPETILRQIEAHLPELHERLVRLKKTLGTDRFQDVLEEVYREISAISFDHGVMERTRDEVVVVPSSCGWSDVGSWASLFSLKSPECDDRGNVAEGECLQIDCEGNYVSGHGGRLVACLGLKNCLVVDTADALLVADLNRSQDIRKVVDQLKRQGKERLL